MLECLDCYVDKYRLQKYYLSVLNINVKRKIKYQISTFVQKCAFDNSASASQTPTKILTLYPTKDSYP